VSFEDEWRQIQTDAAAKKKPGMQLDHVAPEPGGSGGPDLTVNTDQLGVIGHNAYELYNRLSTDGNHATDSTSTAATALTQENFRTGSALTTLGETWGSQVQTLLDACGNISNQLDYTISDQKKNDGDIAVSMSASKISQYFK
jgi:hypothetical protein